MPKAWIVKFHEAALEADAELLSQLLEKIPEFPERELQDEKVFPTD